MGGISSIATTFPEVLRFQEFMSQDVPNEGDLQNSMDPGLLGSIMQ